MREKGNESDNLHQRNDDEKRLLLQRVKWTEDGIMNLGTVTEILTIKGTKYLIVMTIFGKRCKVKMSKVRLISNQVRA